MGIVFEIIETAPPRKVLITVDLDNKAKESGEKGFHNIYLIPIR